MASIGSTPGIIVGVGVGAAASAAIEPALELPKQNAWKALPHKVLDAATMARLYAQGGVSLDVAQADGLRDGYDKDKINALAYLAQTVPGVAESLDLWRKFDNYDDLWTHSLVKQGLDARYLPYLNKLKQAELLGLGDLAYAVVRGIVPDQGILPVAPPTTTDNIKGFPVVNLDVIAEAARLGFSEDLLKIMIGRSGLSMAPGMAAQGFFRGVLSANDYLLAIAQGDLRTEYGDAVREVSRQILTAGEYSEAELRGYSTTKQRLANTAKHGMSQEDSDLLHLIQGRPVAVHQVTTGLARGGTYPSLYTDVPEPYQAAIRESDIKEPWASIAYHNRYTLPSGFQIKAETQSGDITQAQSEQLLLEAGWDPKWASVFSSSWATPKAKSASSHVSKAQTQLWGTIHKAYLNHHATDTDARTALTAAGVPADQIDQVLALWQAERDLTRKELTAKQIIGAPSTDPQYGTDAQKQLALQNLGYSPDDILVLLGE